MEQLKHVWHWWITPLQRDTDTAFRERTLRLALPLFTLTSLLQTTLVLLTSEISIHRIAALILLLLLNLGMIYLLVRGQLTTACILGMMTFMSATGILQTTIKKGNLKDEEFEDAKKALIESSLELSGVVKTDERAPGGYELQVNSVNIMNFAEPFPIVKDQSPEFLLDQRHLWIRSQKLTSVFKIRSTVVGAIHKFFRM